MRVLTADEHSSEMCTLDDMKGKAKENAEDGEGEEIEEVEEVEKEDEVGKEEGGPLLGRSMTRALSAPLAFPQT